MLAAQAGRRLVARETATDRPPETVAATVGAPAQNALAPPAVVSPGTLPPTPGPGAPAPTTTPAKALGPGPAVSQLVQRDPAPAAASAPTAATTDPKVTELQTQATRLKNQQRATLLLDQFKEEVLIRITGWEIAILNLGSAYARAAKNHSDAVEKKKKADAIKSQVMFSLLTVASAGGLAWISGAVQAAKGAAAEASLLTNTLEDVLQNSAAEAFSANGPGLDQRVPTVDQTAVSDDPLVFQNQRMGRLKAAQLQAHTQFKTFTADLLKRPDADWDKYDEKAQTAPYAAWLAKADLLSGGAKLPTVDVMADELERAFWAKWAPALKVAKGEIDNVEQGFTYVSPSTAVEERFDTLGITKASGVDDFGWWTSDKEIIKVITWANGYQVKPFIA